MKNVIAMIGSLRKESVNRQIYNTYKELAQSQLVLSEAVINELPFYNQDIVDEPAVVTGLADQLLAADAIIFFSPEYNYSVPGVLKNAIDWLSRNKNQPFNNKPAAIIGGSPGRIGTARMQYHLRQIGVFLNLQFLNKPEVMIDAAHEKVADGRLTDERSIEFLKSHVEQFAAFIDAKK